MNRPTHQGSAKDRHLQFPVGASITIEQLENDAWRTLARLRSEEPVSWVPALDAWYVTSRDLALEAMRDATNFTVDDPRFTTGAILGPSMLSLDGPEHHRHRSPFAPGFRPGVLREHFDDFLAAEVQRLIAHFDGGPAELRTGLAGPLAVTTITRFLGLDGVSPSDVLAWYGSIAKAITDLTVTGVVSARDQTAIDHARSRVDASIASSASNSILKSIEATGALAADELGSSALVIMFGAIETAEGMTANLLWHLLTTPGAWQSMRADRQLVPAAIEESLRLEPAASLVDRYTTSAVSIGDVTIPTGELVTLSLLAANHDPSVFDQPERFDLSRENSRQHVTFVQGPHACLGLHLARMETAAAVNGLLDAVADPVVDRERSTPPSGLIFRKPDQLWINW